LQIDEVKQFYFEFLQNVLSSGTCFDILTAANQYQNKQLKEPALECITEGLGNVEFNNNLSKDEFVSCIAKMKENKAIESAIYYAVMSWIKFDVATRENHFKDLLFLINFTQITPDFIQKTILKEDLVIKNHANLKYVTDLQCFDNKANEAKRGNESNKYWRGIY